MLHLFPNYFKALTLSSGTECFFLLLVHSEDCY
uniref:Uncharacterized protein n=1 Tax=Anguilla anguilla TaxID=7936 RepID=A0A0E9V1V6_ANGAN